MKKLQLCMFACLSIVATGVANSDFSQDRDENLNIYIKNNTNLNLPCEIKKVAGTEINWPEDQYGAKIISNRLVYIRPAQQKMTVSFTPYAARKHLTHESIGIKLYSGNFESVIALKFTMDYERFSISSCLSKGLKECTTYRSDTGIEEYVLENNFKLTVQKSGANIMITIDAVKPEGKKPGWKFWQ